jgi:hypothetical protein
VTVSQANFEQSPFGEQPQQEAPRYRKPRADLYTMLLLIAWIAILLGILCLYLEMKQYGPRWNKPPVTQLPRPAATSTFQAPNHSHDAGGASYTARLDTSRPPQLLTIC